MNINILVPESLSIAQNLKNGFGQLGHKIKVLDYKNYIKKVDYGVNNQIFRLPFMVKKYWNRYYFKNVEASYKQLIHENNADLYIVYNSQMLTPLIVSHIKTQGSKICFIMGDSPYYTKTNQHYLQILFHANHIFSPDTHWIEQLNMLGLNNVSYLIPGFNPDVFKTLQPTIEQLKKYESNCVFMGLNYDSLLGFKRTLFLSKFAKFGLTIYGDKNWYRWVERFPELKSCLKFKDHFITDEEWNLICNCAKIHPIDANPGLTNGIHIRVFDSIGSGILPIAEYRKDMDFVFPGNMLPNVKSYDEIEKIATFYLSDDVARKQKIDELRSHILKNFNNKKACEKILSVI